MRFGAPELLWLLALVPVLGFGALFAERLRRRSLARFAGGPAFLARFDGQISGNRRAAKILLFLLALSAGILAAARPQWGTRLEPVHRRGVDVVVLIDTSLSMATEDVAPSRLARARQAVETLLGRLAGNRVALVPFAGQASLACPLTLDSDAASLFLDAVDVESVAVPGSALAQALDVAIRAYGPGDPQGRSRAVVLFTDGEDHEGGLEQATERLRRAGVSVYALGVGTPSGGPIPVRDDAGVMRGYKKDGAGRVVTSRLEEEALEKLALATDGRYYRLSPAGNEIGEIAEAIGGMSQRDFGSVLRTRYEERFQIPLAICLAALVVETLLGDRKKARRAESAEVSP